MPTFAQKKDKYTESEFRAKKQAYIAQKAELTPAESEKFFPLYFEFQNKKKEINKHAWNLAKQGKASETTDLEYEEIIDNFFDDQEAIVKLEREYIDKYRKILSDKGEFLDGFDGEIFETYVDRIVVKSQTELEFQMKCGLNLIERI